MQIGFYFDQTRCTGCSACRVACKDWHDIPAGPENWMRIHYTEKGTFPAGIGQLSDRTLLALPGAGLRPGLPGGGHHQTGRRRDRGGRPLSLSGQRGL